MNANLWFLLLLAAAFLPAYASCNGGDAPSGPGRVLLISDRETRGEPEPALHEAVLQYEYVLLHQDVALGDQIREGDTLRLEVFDDVRITARVTRLDERMPGVHSFRASFVPPPDSGHVLVSVQDKRAAGTVEWWTAGRRFHLRFDPDRQRHYIMEVDPALEDRLPGREPLE